MTISTQRSARKMTFHLSIVFLALATQSNHANAAVLVEEGGVTTNPSIEAPQSEESSSSRATLRLDRGTAYLDGRALRKDRTISVGPVFGGPAGLVGLQGEFNVQPEISILAGFGGGVGFRSISFQVKRVFEGTYVLPYVAGGYSRWYSSGGGVESGPVDQTNPEFLRNAFLSQKSKESGNFGEDLIFPTVGLQYLQLNGVLAGFSVFAEVSALVDLNRLVMAPTGALGSIYYF